MTHVERTIWFELRNRRLGGFKFKRQWTIGKYVVDFCCIERCLIVEIDGGQHSPESDAARSRALEGAGYRVVRFWNNEVQDNLEGVLTRLLAELGRVPHHIENSSSPNELGFRYPLPQAGEGAL